MMSDDVYLDIIAKLETLDTLAEKINESRLYASLIPDLEREYKQVHSSLTKQLDDIDVTGRGNFGWEGRMVAFLRAFRIRMVERDSSKGGK